MSKIKLEKPNYKTLLTDINTEKAKLANYSKKYSLKPLGNSFKKFSVMINGRKKGFNDINGTVKSANEHLKEIETAGKNFCKSCESDLKTVQTEICSKKSEKGWAILALANSDKADSSAAFQDATVQTKIEAIKGELEGKEIKTNTTDPRKETFNTLAGKIKKAYEDALKDINGLE